MEVEKLTAYCRKARKLRAEHDGDPIRMHKRLSQLSITAAGKEMEALHLAAPEGEPTSRKSRAIRWTWTQTARLGKGGMTVLSKLGCGLSMSATDDTHEDHSERHELVDPDESPISEGYPSASDQTFAALVDRTLQAHPKSPLRYSQRLALLKEAGQRGIGRFEANLIIASVQHRLKLNTPAATPRKSLRLPGVLAFALIQTIILWGFWRMTRS